MILRGKKGRDASTLRWERLRRLGELACTSSAVYITAEARMAEGVKDCGSLTLARHFFLYRGTRTAELLKQN